MTLQCEQVMGLVRGREIQELVQDATGEPCPCRQGLDCPLAVELGRRAEVRIPRQASA